MNQSDLNKFAYWLMVTLAIVLAVGLVVALLGGPVALPPDWLVNWTDWLLNALGIVLAPFALVTAVQAIRKFAGLA